MGREEEDRSTILGEAEEQQDEEAEWEEDVEARAILVHPLRL
jgi:hypothetical protein